MSAKMSMRRSVDMMSPPRRCGYREILNRCWLHRGVSSRCENASRGLDSAYWDFKNEILLEPTLRTVTRDRTQSRRADNRQQPRAHSVQTPVKREGSCCP